MLDAEYVSVDQWCRPKIVRRGDVHEEILDHTLYECSFSWPRPFHSCQSSRNMNPTGQYCEKDAMTEGTPFVVMSCYAICRKKIDSLKGG